jgi:hypothetical protein
VELTNIPAKLVSGQHAKWTIALEDFPSSEWTLTYHLRGSAAKDVSATVSLTEPSGFDVDLLAVANGGSTPLTPGQYFWQSYATNVSDPTDKRLVGSGRVEVLTDFSNPLLTSFDGRTTNEKIWAAIKAMIAKKATRDQMSFTIGQRTISRIPMDQLIQFEQHYAKLVSADRRQARIDKGESPFENILTQFKEPR